MLLLNHNKKNSIIFFIIVVCSSAFAATFWGNVTAGYSLQSLSIGSISEFRGSAGGSVRAGALFDKFPVYAAVDCSYFHIAKSYTRFCSIPNTFDFGARIGSGSFFNRFKVLGEFGIRLFKPYLMLETDVAFSYGFPVSDKIDIELILPVKFCFNASGSVIGAGLTVGVGICKNFY